jgi:hypothetical protein
MENNTPTQQHDQHGNEQQYKSLYEYLGKPAGGELGQQVARDAGMDGVKIGTQYVNTLRYQGNILTYPVEWLDKYFNKQQQCHK